MKRRGSPYAQVQAIADERCLLGLRAPQPDPVADWLLGLAEAVTLGACVVVGLWLLLGPVVCLLVN